QALGLGYVLRVLDDRAVVVVGRRRHDVAPHRGAVTARGRLHDRVLVEGISECPAHVDIPEQRVLRPVDPLGPVVEADVVVREVGVDVAVDPGRRRDGVNGRAVDLGVPVDVTVDDGLGRRGGVGDDLFDDVRDVRLAAVVV